MKPVPGRANERPLVCLFVCFSISTMKPVPGRANERPHRNGQDEGERADLPDSSEDGRQVLPFYRQPQTYNNWGECNYNDTGHYW